MNEAIRPRVPQRCAPSEEEIADVIVQYKTGGMCHYGKVCNLCDCGFEGLSPKQVVESFESQHELDMAQAIQKLYAAQPTVREAKAAAWDAGADAQYQILGGRLTADSSNNPYRSEADHVE